MSRIPKDWLATIALFLTLGGVAGGQTISAGSLPDAPNFGFNPAPTTITAIDLSSPATGTGVMTSATFIWSLAPCPGTVKIKFFRRSGDTLFFLGERGPFDVTATTELVALLPSVPVQAGDLVGIARVASCGSPVGQSPGGSAGLVAFAGDVKVGVTISSGQSAPNSTLAVQATGTASGGPSGGPATVIPVVISSPGLLGSNFHSAAQFHNPGPSAITGRFVFHSQGVPGSPSDPSVAFGIDPGKTIFYDDLLAAMSQTGLGSVDVILLTGTTTPVASVRVYNDSGPLGTSGFTEEDMKPSQALTAGSRGVLIGPPDTTLFRLNVGVRTLSSGASVSVTVKSSDGVVLRTFGRAYPADFFQQTDVATFLGGTPLGANQTITVDVLSGSLFLYGATADNISKDPAIQFARNIL